MKTRSKLLCVAIFMSSCTPNLYFIDRHTIMEEESAGDWVDLEAQLLNNLKRPGTTMIEKDLENSRKQKVFSSLNGELSREVK